MANTITELRYLKGTNVQNEQKLYAEYFRDLIHSYGVDVTYFRKDMRYFDVPSGLCNYTYGEDTTATYYLSAPMVVFIEVTNDSFVLNNMGIETHMDITFNMTVNDFNEQFRDILGQLTSGHVYSTINCSLSGFTGDALGTFNISGEFAGLSGFTSAYIDLSSSPSGVVSMSYDASVMPLYKPVNPLIKLVHFYNYGYQKTATGNLTGTLNGQISEYGDGYVSGIVEGDVAYFKSPVANHGPGWDYNIAPQVGDFYRISFSPENHEEYEVTEVNDRRLTSDSQNILMGKFIWRCTSARRDPGKEDVLGIEEQEEQTTDKLEENQWAESVSDRIFDYSKNPVDSIDNQENEDKVYGGYSNY